MKFTVRMSRWYRGKGSGDSRLRRSIDGKMCCLGFREVAVGHPLTEITDVDLPCRLYRTGEDVKPEDEVLIDRENLRYNWYEPSSICNKIVPVNDNTMLSDDERIKQLTELFASMGDQVTFVP